MPGVSRRGLVVGALAAPLGVGAPGTRAAPGAAFDPVIATASDWIAVCELTAAMQAEWQALETALFARADSLNLDPALACRSGLAEAKAMRALDRRINAGYRRMRRIAEQASATPALSLAGALAKIDLGLKVQGPYDWSDNALDLIEDGVAEARYLGV